MDASVRINPHGIAIHHARGLRVLPACGVSSAPCLVLFQLYFSDPSGMFVRYKCKAIGSGSEGAQSTLQEGYSDSLTLAEAETLAVSTLKQVRRQALPSAVCPGACLQLRQGWALASHCTTSACASECVAGSRPSQSVPRGTPPHVVMAPRLRCKPYSSHAQQCRRDSAA